MTVLVLCHGAICRSPMAVAVMKRAGLTDVHCAGFKPADERSKPSPKKVRDWAMENEGLDLSLHRSKSVTVDMLRRAEIILYMDSGQMGRLETLWEENGLAAELGPVYARARPLAAYLTTPLGRIGDPMFQKPETQEFMTIMGQLVEASTRFAREWQELKKGDAQVAGLQAAATASTDGAPEEAAA